VTLSPVPRLQLELIIGDWYAAMAGASSLSAVTNRLSAAQYVRW
jgi:hypothetical protein